MWKYVSRRVRETYDRFSNVLDLHKTWSCGAQQIGPSSSLDNEHAGSNASKGRCEISKCPTIRLFLCDRSGAGSSKNNGSKEQHRRKVRDGEDPMQNEFLGAIKWSGAIIFGWYSSHLLCLHHRQYGRQDRGYFYKIYNIPSKALHTNVRSYFASASPARPSIVSEKVLWEHFSFSSSSDASSTSFEDVYKKDEKPHVLEVNNDSGHGSDDAIKQDQSVRDAVADLVSYLGELEFKFGVQDIAAGNFPSAVAHLQLATGHRHPGATFNLGICYERGLGVRKNLKLAMECYQKASALGHSKAMYNLGVFYAQGLGGLPKDQSAAEQCFTTAAKMGQPEARDALNIKKQSDKGNWTKIPF